MKLRKILNEIGDSLIKPKTVTFHENGYIEFSISNSEYCINIGLVVDYQNKLGITISFNILNSKNFNDYVLTNENIPLTLLGNIMWCVIEWLKKFHLNKELIYITYDPKMESDKQNNSRDRMYRIFIEKMARKQKSSVQYSERGGIHAIFKPSIKITKNL